MNNSSSLANQMKHRDREMVPLFLVRAMFGLMFASVALVTFAKVTDQPLTGVRDTSPVIKEVAITLEGNRSDGVNIIDPTGTIIAHSSDDKAGFIDVIWNSVTRERIVQDIISNDPLRLVRRENGHTAIIDPATGWSIELIGYGQDNVAAFASLLD
ncbi:photosynthetic complex assembly protein PuhC [Yoonia sp. 208BN28-4]|uniref:photosynthetic complex assembly protein PuhC n=1 Tax=Yoonia sp. 208BN28-4 TaxID=3126505 RepID=UPI0030AB8C15